MFDGEGSSMGDSNGDSTQSQQGETEIKYGKQPTDSDTQEIKETEAEASSTPKKTFKELISGEYKDDYTKATQEIINKRFKETKEMQAKIDSLTPLQEALSLKYGIEDGNIDSIMKAIDSDSEFLAAQAEEHGMTVEQYKQFTKLESQNKVLRAAQAQAESQQKADAQIQEWMQQADILKETFPNFDLNEEVKNEAFIGMLKAGVPMEHAFKVAHYDALMQDAIEQNTKATEKAVTENIRAKGNRPQENGTNLGSAFTIKNDVHKLTKEDRAEIARKASRGEYIEF